MLRSPHVRLLAVVFLISCPVDGLAQLQMRVHLGQNDELEVDATYHDPVEIDQKLSGTRVMPMLLRVRNTTRQPVPLDYGDITLHLGSDAGLTLLQPVAPEAAHTMLLEDGRYNEFLRFVGTQGDRFTTINPFERIFPSGSIRPGQTRSGYVFFVRPAGVAFTSFLAVGTQPLGSAMLKTNDIQVMAPATESSKLWPAAMRSWPDRFREKRQELRAAISTIVNGPPPYKRSYALVMGVWDYQFMDKLPRVKNDLDRMSAVLRELGFTVVRVDNDKLTMANVRSPQEFFASVAKITEDDRLLVFFAGHGFPRQEGGQVRGYLALRNARIGEANREHTIAMDDFVAWTRRVPAKHLLVLLESCFSGLAVGIRPGDIQTMGPSTASPSGGTPNPRTLYQLSRDPGRYLMMAGDENQRVPMGSEWGEKGGTGGGLFAHAVVEGLRGRADGDRDGYVTARELYPWLRTYVAEEAARVLGSTVTPLIKDLDPRVSKGEFVFTTAR